jgi:hypothetical protein
VTGAAALLLLGPPAGAATLASFGTIALPGFSTGTFGPISTAAPNNDNAVAASPNAVPVSVFFNTQGTLDMEFVLASSGGTTEYAFTQTLVNNTGTAWTGFRYVLGYGTGAGFVASTLADGLDFDTPDADPAPAANGFPLLIQAPDMLEWSGGTVPSVSGLAVSFAVDVPDGLAAFNPSGENRFTLRQVPVGAVMAIPAPGSLVVLGPALGLLLLGRRRGLRRRLARAAPGQERERRG